MTERLITLYPVDTGRTRAQKRLLRGGIAVAVAVHALLLAVLIWRPDTTPVRVTVARQGSISAYVNITPAPAATTGARPKVAKPREVSLASARNAPEPEPASNESGAGQDTAAGAQGGGPVRMSVGQIQLVHKVEPVYPPLMVAANRTGTVVLDAIINPDGTIGDVTILQSQGPQFDKAAIAAVKQWRYTPPGFQAILTVTVIFSLR